MANDTMTHDAFNAMPWALQIPLDDEAMSLVVRDVAEADVPDIVCVSVWDLSGEHAEVRAWSYGTKATRDGIVRRFLTEYGTADDLHAFDWAGAI